MMNHMTYPEKHKNPSLPEFDLCPLSLDVVNSQSVIACYKDLGFHQMIDYVITSQQILSHFITELPVAWKEKKKLAIELTKKKIVDHVKAQFSDVTQWDQVDNDSLCVFADAVFHN
jgi:hypothetical protein